MTPFRMTPIGRILRSTRQSTRKDVAGVLIISILVAAFFAVSVFGIVRHVIHP